MGTVSITIECKACKATGIYSGMAELDDSGVVCRSCHGTGATTLTGTEFEAKKLRDDIDKVFHGSGFCVSKYSRGGVSYDEWLEDVKAPAKVGNELRDYQCPMWRYQSILYKIPMELWSKCDTSPGLEISKCKHFGDKHECWEQLDKESHEKGYGDNLWEVEEKKGDD